MKLLSAQNLANKIRQELLPFCDKITVAGSIRRGRPEVNDIDLVLIPHSPADQREIIARCAKSCRQENMRASQNLRFFFPNGTQLDLFIAHGPIVDLVSNVPSNWGAVLLCRTGSVAHNVQLCNAAVQKGVKFAPYRGITKGGEILAAEHEVDIYHALGLTYREPTDREQLVDSRKP